MDDQNDAGLAPADTQQLDLSKATYLRRRTPLVEQHFTSTREEAVRSMGVAPQVVSPEVTQIDEPIMAPPPADAALTIPQAPPASQPPVDAAYPRRVNERINKLYGERQEAREYAAGLEAKLEDQRRRIDALQGGMQPAQPQPQQPQFPYTNQYGSTGPGTPPDGALPAGAISRAELQAILANERQVIADIFKTSTSHTAARTEAERDFPEIFNDPGMRAEYNRIWQSDPHLQRDPMGPYKAAALVRGLTASETRAAAAQAAVADVRKTALAGVGLSVPEGSGQPINQDLRYRQAIAIASRTDDPMDWARANRIRNGLE
jgi:hypothetical protein